MISDIELYLKGNKLIIGEVLGEFVYTFANTWEKINQNDMSCSKTYKAYTWQIKVVHKVAKETGTPFFLFMYFY